MLSNVLISKVYLIINFEKMRNGEVQYAGIWLNYLRINCFNTKYIYTHLYLKHTEGAVFRTLLGLWGMESGLKVHILTVFLLHFYLV